MTEQNDSMSVIIKTANQLHNFDYSLSCTRLWTVKYLKEHLSIHHPDKPAVNGQRLIYSGHLLTDEMTIDKLITNANAHSSPVIHLVYSSPDNSSQQKSEEQSKANPHPNNMTDPNAQTDYTGYTGYNFWPNYAQTFNYYMQPWLQSPQPYLRSGHVTSAEYAAMRHYYTMQYLQYINFHNTYPGGVYPGPFVSVAEPPVITEVIPHPAVVPNNIPANDAQPANNVMPANNVLPAPNQNLVMNAQGGQMEEDDEIGRDWLDWIYVVCRFSILLCIIYFYSSLSRFVTLLTVFIFLYLYQSGYLQLQRIFEFLNPRPRAAPAAPAPVAPPNLNQVQEHAPNITTQAENANENASDAVTPRRPGFLHMTWCFIYSFFSSLFPQQVPDVNAN